MERAGAPKRQSRPLRVQEAARNVFAGLPSRTADDAFGQHFPMIALHLGEHFERLEGGHV